MTQTMRFGRRLALPSTLQIKRELTLLMREDVRLAAADKEKAEAVRGPPGVEPPTPLG